jgi:hypothetical protein
MNNKIPIKSDCTIILGKKMSSDSKKDESFAGFVSKKIWRGETETKPIAVSKTMRTLPDGRQVPVKAHIRKVKKK